MFRPAEQGQVSINHTTAFLWSYRAIAYEYFSKESAIRAHKLIAQQADRGRPFNEQCALQDYAYSQLCGLKMGMKDLEELKSRYWNLYKKSAFHDFHFYAVSFSDVLPVVSCGALSPEYDFLGNNIQNILRSDQPIEQVAFNLTSVGGKSFVIFGWLDAGGPAERLAASFRKVPAANKANAAVSFAFEYQENTMMRPSWWNHCLR